MINIQIGSHCKATETDKVKEITIAVAKTFLPQKTKTGIRKIIIKTKANNNPAIKEVSPRAEAK